jgi:hypothetical protein
MEFLAASYLVMLLRAAFLGGDHKEEGTLVEVDRNGRNAMVAGGIARDATDEEIARFRGGASGGVTDDPDLPAAQAELSALAGQKQALTDEVGALGVTKGTLTIDVDDLQRAKQELTGELEALEQGKTALASEVESLEQGKAKLVEEVAELEKAKKAAAKAAK